MSTQPKDDVIGTVTREFDSDVDDVEVTVRAEEEPPEELAEAVHSALQRTILHVIDGREVLWRQDGDKWLLIFPSGMPEMPLAPGKWVPPYRTREKFEGADGSGEGLIGNLPDGWEYGIERGNSVFAFLNH